MQPAPLGAAPGSVVPGPEPGPRWLSPAPRFCRGFFPALELAQPSRLPGASLGSAGKTKPRSGSEAIVLTNFNLMFFPKPIFIHCLW